VTAENGGAVASCVWAYHKAPATLDYLRVTIGDEAFREGVRTYLDRCAFQTCGMNDFQEAMEDESGQDLASLFEHFFYESSYPEIELSFAAAQEPGVLSVLLTQDQSLVVPIELWVELEDGSIERHAVVLDAPEKSFALPVGGPVLSVRPNPREESFVHVRSRTAGDVTLDGDVDGLDVLHAAWRLDRSATPFEGHGDSVFFQLDVDFDPRCDLDGDAAIGQADLDPILSAFGTLGPR